MELEPLTPEAAVAEVAEFLSGHWMPVHVGEEARREVASLWREALHGRLIETHPEFILVNEDGRPRLWAVHRETGLVFERDSSLDREAWLSGVEARVHEARPGE